MNGEPLSFQFIDGYYENVRMDGTSDLIVMVDISSFYISNQILNNVTVVESNEAQNYFIDFRIISFLDSQISKIENLVVNNSEVSLFEYGFISSGEEEKNFEVLGLKISNTYYQASRSILSTEGLSLIHI